MNEATNRSHGMKRVLSVIASAVAALALLVGIGVAYVIQLEHRLLAIGPNGRRTPATVGLRYEHARVPSNGHFLDNYVVRAPAACKPQAALLIFHGVGETISQWVGTQRLLYDRCISSMVFDYAGEGNSTGAADLSTFDADSAVMYQAFVKRFSQVRSRCVLGFSMGNGIMLSQVDKFSPAPGCIVVGSAFSSGRDSAHYGAGIPFTLLRLFPDPWNNVQNVTHIRSPLLLVHSDTDHANALWMGEAVFRAAPQPKQLAIVHGLRHNAPLHASTAWWAPVVHFVRRCATGACSVAKAGEG